MANRVWKHLMGVGLVEPVDQIHDGNPASHPELLNDLAAQNGGGALERRLRHYERPRILVLDELGYLPCGNHHADLLFEVVSRRYQEKPIVLTTNKPFAEWSEVFPNTACVVALVDRLVQRRASDRKAPGAVLWHCAAG